ncbi:hypothetical protein ACHE4L_002642 [Vibrio vulnificus]|nr:hypothetical protein [Vibrio vulnificus]
MDLLLSVIENESDVIPDLLFRISEHDEYFQLDSNIFSFEVSLQSQTLKIIDICGLFVPTDDRGNSDLWEQEYELSTAVIKMREFLASKT